MNSQIGVFVSDIHCGSELGLAPPIVKTRRGNVIGFGDNIHQEWLWDCWLKFNGWAKKIIGKDKADLFVNGDATESSHHHNEDELITADIERHADIALSCLKPLASICDKIFVTRGTECHTDGMEDKIAEKLKAETRQARDKWLIEFNGGFLVDVAHHMPTTSRKHLEATALSIMMANAQSNYLRTCQRVPRGFIRAHRHCGGRYDDGFSFFTVTGGWQFLTRHGCKVVTDSIPRPSGMILDWRGLSSKELPHIHQLTFNPDQDEIFPA